MKRGDNVGWRERRREECKEAGTENRREGRLERGERWREKGLERRDRIQ